MHLCDNHWQFLITDTLVTGWSKGYYATQNLSLNILFYTEYQDPSFLTFCAWQVVDVYYLDESSAAIYYSEMLIITILYYYYYFYYYYLLLLLLILYYYNYYIIILIINIIIIIIFIFMK